MMPTWAWLVLAVSGSLVAVIVPWASRFFARALAHAIIDAIATELRPMWQADIKPIEEQVADIKAEVTTNGGGSLKDRVLEMHRQLEAVAIRN